MRASVSLALLVVGCDGDLRFERAVSDASAPDVAAFECRDDRDCTEDNARRCDVAAHVCVECGTTADCSGGEVCEPMSKHCMRACSDAEPCPTDTPVCDARGLCVCIAGSCTSSDRSICSFTGRCVECASDAHCTEPEHPRCDVSRGECVE